MVISKGNNTSQSEKRFLTIRNCMLIAGLSVFAQLYLFQPMLSELSRYFDISIATSSLAVSCSTLGMAAGLFAFAFLADNTYRERLMGFSLLLSAVFTLLTASASNFTLFLALNFLKGAVLSGVSAVALSYLTEETDKSRIGLAISLYLSGNTIGGMTGRVCGTLLSGWSNWQYATLIIGVACLILGFVFIRKIPRSRNFSPSHVSIREKTAQMKQFVTQATFLRMYVIAALSMGVFVSVYNYLSVILESPWFNLPHYMVAMIFVMYTTGVAGSIVSGRLSDRYSPEMLLTLSILAMGAGLAFLLIVKLWAIIVGLGLITFSFFSTHTMASRIVSTKAQTARSSATCLYWLFYYAGSSIMGTLSGVIFARYGWFAFVEVMMAVTCLLFMTSLRKARVMRLYQRHA